MNSILSIDEIIHDYETVVKVVEKNASKQTDRAYGGVVRTVKGKLQEHITEEIVKLAWKNLGGETSRLLINSKKIHIPIQRSYIEHLANEEVRKHICKNIKNYFYGLSVDKHIFIDGKFTMGIECKAYTENAMIKRILIDFHLLKTLYPDISCFLFQLESQLGGDYSGLPETVFGSTSTHSIMSYFEDVDLNIFTFLKGERDIENPIHKTFKPLEHKMVEKAVKLIESYLKKFII
jgi:Fe-S cluster biosynthesis and repair protein YggX